MFENKKTIDYDLIKVGVNVGFFLNDPEGKHPEVKHGVICGEVIKDPYQRENSENPTPLISIAVAGKKTPEGKKLIKSGIPVNMIFPVTDEELAQWVGKPLAVANSDNGTPPPVTNVESSESSESDSIPMDSNANQTNPTSENQENNSNTSHFEKHADKMANDPQYRDKVQNDGGDDSESDSIPTDENPPVENQSEESETPPVNQEEQSDETSAVSQDDSTNDSVESSSPETANTDDSSESGDNDEKQQNTAETAEKPKKEGALASRLSQEARDAHVKLYRLLVEVEDAAESCVPHLVKKINQKQAVNFAKSAERMSKTIRSDFAIRGLEYLIDDPDEQK